MTTTSATPPLTLSAGNWERTTEQCPGGVGTFTQPFRLARLSPSQRWSVVLESGPRVAPPPRESSADTRRTFISLVN